MLTGLDEFALRDAAAVVAYGDDAVVDEIHFERLPAFILNSSILLSMTSFSST
jgi:hypothetical protein